MGRGRSWRGWSLRVDMCRMPDARDMVDLGGRGGSGVASSAAQSGDAQGRFLRLWFKCSGQYARANRAADGSAYVGRCPKCGASATFPIGPGGTSVRLFEMSCR